MQSLLRNMSRAQLAVEHEHHRFNANLRQGISSKYLTIRQKNIQRHIIS